MPTSDTRTPEPRVTDRRAGRGLGPPRLQPSSSPARCCPGSLPAVGGTTPPRRQQPASSVWSSAPCWWRSRPWPMAGGASYRCGRSGPDHVCRHPSGARIESTAWTALEPTDECRRGHPHLVGHHRRHRRRPDHLPAGRARRPNTVTDPDVDGVLFVQLDGVPFPVLQWAVQSGRCRISGYMSSGRQPRVDPPTAMHHTGQPDGHPAWHR